MAQKESNDVNYKKLSDLLKDQLKDAKHGQNPMSVLNKADLSFLNGRSKIDSNKLLNTFAKEHPQTARVFNLTVNRYGSSNSLNMGSNLDDTLKNKIDQNKQTQSTKDVAPPVPPRPSLENGSQQENPYEIPVKISPNDIYADPQDALEKDNGLYANPQIIRDSNGKRITAHEAGQQQNEELYGVARRVTQEEIDKAKNNGKGSKSSGSYSPNATPNVNNNSSDISRC